jgi:hypothetical protein
LIVVPRDGLSSVSSTRIVILCLPPDEQLALETDFVTSSGLFDSSHELFYQKKMHIERKSEKKSYYLPQIREEAR